MIKIINYKTILFISITFSWFVGEGIYGYGNDFYAGYHKQNINWGGWRDLLGWRISTLTVYGKHLGVHVVSLILSLSFGILLKTHFNLNKMKSSLLFLIIYILALHTWPIIMSTSNAMRQGITMSLVFISFSFLLKEKNLKALIFVFISIFTHNSGILFLCIFVIYYFYKFIFKFNVSDKYLSILDFTIGFFIFLLTYILVNTFIGLSEPTRIIEGDYRYPFLMISSFYIIIFTFYNKLLRVNNVILFLYCYSFISPAFLFAGYNWEYERLMMMMTLPYMLVFSNLFTNRLAYIYLFTIFSSLLILTIKTGMFNSLK